MYLRGERGRVAEVGFVWDKNMRKTLSGPITSTHKGPNKSRGPVRTGKRGQVEGIEL